LRADKDLYVNGSMGKDDCCVDIVPLFKEFLTKTPLQVYNSVDVAKGIGDR
jgi:hypothetical protein